MPVNRIRSSRMPGVTPPSCQRPWYSSDWQDKRLASVSQGPGRKSVGPRARRARNFFHSYASSQQRIADHGAMAAPRHGFGTHDDGSSLLSPMSELVQSFLKFWRLHVVGEAAEAEISPSSVSRVTTRVPQTAKLWRMPVRIPAFWSERRSRS